MEQLRNHEQPEAVRPITPEEALEVKKINFPPEVLTVVNRLIGENFREGYATILQKDIVKELAATGLQRKEIFDNHWLDFEDLYREAGWGVTYDKPGYNEDWYEPRFKFSTPDVGHRLGQIARRYMV